MSDCRKVSIPDAQFSGRWRWIVFVFFLPMMFYFVSVAGLMGAHLSTGFSQSRRPHYFALLRPEENTMVVEGPLTFVWENRGDPDPPDFRVQRYEIKFWSKRRDFGRSFTVLPDDSSRLVSLRFEEMREVFRRHGRYYWRVLAFDEEGNQTSSGVWGFVVGMPQVAKRFLPWSYPYAVQLRYTHRLASTAYREFLRTVYPTTHLRSFSDLGLVFRQDGLGTSSLIVQEKFSVLSNVGFGGEFSAWLRLLSNSYFSLRPTGRTAVNWFSTGLEHYSSVQYDFFIGCDCVFMPRQYVSFW